MKKLLYAFPSGAGGIDDFREILNYRMRKLYSQEYVNSDQKNFVMPAGYF